MKQELGALYLPIEYMATLSNASKTVRHFLTNFGETHGQIELELGFEHG
eukprot:SAG31_NODE_40041_length_283_cov_1.679348_1_plen_48_part_01